MKLTNKIRTTYEEKRDERLRKQKISKIRVLIHSSLVGLACWLGFGIAAKIMLSADRLGILFLPILLGYFALVWGAGDWLKQKLRELELRRQVGDETYYACFPEERRKKEKQQARRKKLAQRLSFRRAGETEGESMKLFGKIKELRWTILWPVIETSLWVWPGIFLILVGVQILLHSRTLGWFFVPVILGYIGLLIGAFGYTQIAKSKRDLRGIIGEELYFQLYPKDKSGCGKRQGRRGCALPKL